MRRVTFWPAEFVPVARIVSGYSPGPSVPPLIETLTVWLSPLLRVKLDGLTLTAPSPTGSTPFDCGPPSSVRPTVPPKLACSLLFGVLNVDDSVAGPAGRRRPGRRAPEPVVEKSRLTLPTLIATG